MYHSRILSLLVSVALLVNVGFYITTNKCSSLLTFFAKLYKQYKIRSRDNIQGKLWVYQN